MTKPLISLCMIVKNEDDVLERCLTSVRDVVDEIVIVDTGSTDNTIEIAKKFNAIILNYEWDHDFSSARNLGIEHATSKWILVLDADEEMEPNIHEQLRELANIHNDGILLFTVQSYVDETYSNFSSSNCIRMFPNTPQYRYTGKIHEHINEDNKHAHIPHYSTSISIYHYGFTKERVEKKDKINRNINSLKDAVKKHPNNFAYLYFLGVEYLRLLDFKNGYTYFNRARIQCKKQNNLLPIIYKHEACCLFELGKANKAIQLLTDGTKRFSAYTDLFHIQGMMYMKIQKYDYAKKSLLKAIELGATTKYETQSGIGTYKTYYLLGKLEEELKNYEDSLVYYKEALKSFEDSPVLLECVKRVEGYLI